MNHYTVGPDATKRTRPLMKMVFAVLILLTFTVGTTYGAFFWHSSQASAQNSDGTYEAPVALARTSAQLDSSIYLDQEALADLYEQITPSVVNIQVGASSTSGFQSGGQGSGFIYDYDGHIVTNNHVVEDANEITVLFYNGFWADAELVARDPQADLAVIRVNPPENFDWRPLPLAQPDALRVGHSVIAMGNPFGLDNTMTTGIVSALGRGLPIGERGTRYTLPDVIQTDAAINPGNSGGPLLNLAGEVVGVNFAIESPVRGNSGVGFTIPTSIVRRVVPSLIANGEFNYAYLGLSGSSIEPRVADQLGLPDNRLGIYVGNVMDGGPADRAGVLGGDSEGDIIIGIDGEAVRGFEDMVSYLVTRASPGQTVTLQVLRGNEQLDIGVTLGERPGQQRLASSIAPTGRLNARAAIKLASEYVVEEGLLEGALTEKIASPDIQDGISVWVVELSDGDQTATVVLSVEDGEVLEAFVE